MRQIKEKIGVLLPGLPGKDAEKAKDVDAILRDTIEQDMVASDSRLAILQKDHSWFQDVLTKLDIDLSTKASFRPAKMLPIIWTISTKNRLGQESGLR